MKVFYIRSILTVSKGGRIPFDEGSIELLEFMTGQKLNPDQYVSASFACKGILLHQFPFLINFEKERAVPIYWERDVFMAGKIHGVFHEVAPLSSFYVGFVATEKSENYKKLESLFK